MLTIISCVSVQNGWTQDPVFSQFFSAPIHQNPSMIGFSEAPRFNFNVRDQLISFSNAFVTSSVSYDQHFHKYNSSVGGAITADIAGGLYNTFQLLGAYAYQVELSPEVRAKVGLSAAYQQIYLNYDKFVFPDMIDAIGGAGMSLPSAEISPDRTVKHLFDLGAGMVLYSSKFFAGISFQHLTTPNLSFYDAEDVDNELKLRMNFQIGTTFYGGRQVTGGGRFYLSPNLLLVNQGNFWQVNGGAYLGKQSFFGGLMYRHTFSNSDALIGIIGIKKGVTRVAYSYDFTISGLQTSAGAHEISLTLDFGETEHAKRNIRLRKAANCPEMFKP